MKKLISIIIIFIIAISCFSCVYATNTYELELKTINNTKNEKFDLYILLPKEYITFAIHQSGMYEDYQGASTLKNNDIPGIVVDKNNVQDDTYVLDGVEYVQILLKEDKEGLYKFDILENYPKMNIKFKIKKGNENYIMHIDNFKVDKQKCKMEFDYNNNTVKQPDKIIIPKGVIILIIILIIVLVLGIISKVKTKE